MIRPTQAQIDPQYLMLTICINIMFFVSEIGKTFYYIKELK